MPLTNTEVKNAKYNEAGKKNKRFDGGGMFLHLYENGSKYWRLKYRFAGKEKLLSIGTYPEVSLKEARVKREEAKKQLSESIDPSEFKQLAKLTGDNDNFEHVAREWHTKYKKTKWSEDHGRRILTRLEKDIFPWLGGKLISAITAQELLAVLRRIENRGALETAHRAMQNETGPLVFVRPVELRHAEWSEIDLDNAEWKIPAGKMKMRQVHIVPLSTQAVEILTEIKPLTGKGQYVFPSIRTNKRPMSENTVLAGLRRLGYNKEEMTGHGFRSMASTLLNEQGWHKDAIERQLAHAERDTACLVAISGTRCVRYLSTMLRYVSRKDSMV